MVYKLKFRNILLFSLGFVLCTIIGTLSHELGHAFMAKYLGYKPTLHFNSTEYVNDDITEYRKLERDKKENKTSTNHGNYDLLKQKILVDRFWITLAGPLQTIVFGTISFLILIFFYSKNKNTFPFWFFTYLSLFWMRQPFVFFHSLITGLQHGLQYPLGGDEYKLSAYLRIWPGTIGLILAIIGIVIVGIIFKKIIPRNQNLEFIISTVIGCCLGYLLWMKWLGPTILS